MHHLQDQGRRRNAEAEEARPRARGTALRAPDLSQEVLLLQRQVGNQAVARLVRERGSGDQLSRQKKVKASSGGYESNTLDITYNVSGVKADGLQVIQAWWGSGNTIGQKVGNTDVKMGKKNYEAFIDGGQYSPWVTLSGESPAHATQPYYLTADEVTNQVTWDKDHGTVRIYDLPSASAHFDEMFFETAIVAVNVDGKGTDKIVKVFTWGNTKQGTVTQHKKGEKIGGKHSHVKAKSGPSSTFKKILKNDYPGYKFK